MEFTQDRIMFLIETLHDMKASEIHRIIENRWPNEISMRRVQEIVKSFKDGHVQCFGRAPGQSRPISDLGRNNVDG